MGLQVYTRIQDIIWFIVGVQAYQEWLMEKLEGWDGLTRKLSGIAHRHMQVSYATMHSSLQQECHFVKHITPNVG